MAEIQQQRCPDCGGPARPGWWHTVDCPAPASVPTDPPVTLTTASELDALPVGSVVLDTHNLAWHKMRDGLWLSEHGSAWSSGRMLDYGEYVLYRPDAPAQPTPTSVDGDAVERAARVLWEDARQEYDYDWEPNADRFRDLARAALAAARAAGDGAGVDRDVD